MTAPSLHARLAARLLTGVGLVTMICAGGGCSESTILTPVVPIAREDFCAELVDARCDVVERCGCGAAASALCRADITRDCTPEFFAPEVEASIAAGRIVYDALEAGRLVAHIRSDPPLCGDRTALGFRLRDLIDFAGAFQGTVAPGSPCTGLDGFPNECQLARCWEGVCPSPPADRGEACGPTTACGDLDAPIDFDDWSNLALRCAITPGAATGTCQSLLPGGATCVGDEDCVTRTCEAGSCAAPIAVDGACVSDEQCASRRCIPTGSGTSRCIVGDAANGAACSYDWDCASYGCGEGTCMVRLCAAYTASAPVP